MIRVSTSLLDAILPDDFGDNDNITNIRLFQRVVDVGDLFWSWCSEKDTILYGKVVPWQDVVWQWFIFSNDSELHFQWESIRWTSSVMADYRCSKLFSSEAPAGEYGVVHISSIIDILSEESWKMLESVGWPSSIAEARNILLYGKTSE